MATGGCLLAGVLGGPGALVEGRLVEHAQQGRQPLGVDQPEDLDIALGLYRRMGFVDVTPPDEMTVLARTEVIMAKDAG